MDNNEDELFKEAANSFLNSAKNTDSLPEVIIEKTLAQKKEELFNEAIDFEENNNWQELVRDMSDSHAKKFNNILKTLPDREFVRAYLKALEYFKPKIIRTDQKPTSEVDNTITVQIVQKNDKGEINIITIGKDEKNL